MFFSADKNLKPEIPKELAAYNKFNLASWEKALRGGPEKFWQKLGEKRALKIFHLAAKQAPAYKDFLKKNKIDADKIKTIQDFNLVPPTDKANYVQRYPLAARCLGGNLESAKIIASSSGTSGNPNYWPRSDYQEYEAAITHELLFKNLFHIDKYSTLMVIGFPMGVYVSGAATLLPSWLVSRKYRLTVVSAGNNKLEALKAVKNLSRDFNQLLLIGHPFFIKDVLETGAKERISWKSKKIGLMFCSEGFSESWREYVLKIAGQKFNQAAAYNTYGSSEMLLMAYETALSVKVRQIMEKHSTAAKQLLGGLEVPNLFQYNPALRFIQEKRNELLFTSFSGLPLIRFNLHDNGKILSYEQAVANLNRHLPDTLFKTAWKLPFVTVAGRSDSTIIFYAANIYPQHIHFTLNHRQLLKKLTGKFAMTKGYYKDMDEHLAIHIELKPGIKPKAKLQHSLAKMIFDNLRKINSEFLDASNRLGKKTFPKVYLWPYNHKRYFKPGLKPKYIV